MSLGPVRQLLGTVLAPSWAMSGGGGGGRARATWADDERTDGERQERLKWKRGQSSRLWPRCRQQWSHIWTKMKIEPNTRDGAQEQR